MDVKLGTASSKYIESLNVKSKDTFPFLKLHVLDILSQYHKKIINENSLNWTEFLVEHADEDQFKVYTDYALNNENFSMLYKYLKPFAVRSDVPESLYPTLGYLALWAYFNDENEENLNDSIKYFEISYKKKQNEEAALFALIMFSNVSGDESKALKYMEMLYKKYPKSFEKLVELWHETEEDNEEDLIRAFIKYIEYLGTLIEG